MFGMVEGRGRARFLLEALDERLVGHQMRRQRT